MVNTVLLELSTELICDNIPLASPAITIPLRPTGTSSRTSDGNAWSLSFSPGNSLNATMPGITTSSGSRIFMKPANTTPIRASHSLRAPRQRCTMNWLVQLYHTPTEMNSTTPRATDTPCR